MPTPNTTDAMKRYRAGKAGFTDKAHLKAKGLIPRADGTKRKSPKYEAIMGNPNLTHFLFTYKDSSSVFGNRIQMKKITAKNQSAATAEFKRMKPKAKMMSVKKLSDLHSDLDKSDVKTIRPIIKQLQKSVKTHATQAKQLTKDISDDMDRQPQDKDVKKKKGTQPKKYYKTLDKSTKKKRADFFKKQKYKKSDDDDDYKPAPGDKGAKTKPSIHTKKFKKMYGEDAPANATGVAVAGTGDDSSTVIVRKRKEMRDRLLKRFKIKESIDRAIPDIVEEPDEIRTRTNQLKELAKEKQEIEEKIKGLENKAKKTGMPYGILKKVYDRGMAAWKGGHRPGTTQQQWAFARVNSFVTKSSGTWGGADKDLAKQVRARG